MKSDFLLAITQLSAEKNLPREVVIKAVETALVSAYKKDNFPADLNISVRINPNTARTTKQAKTHQKFQSVFPKNITILVTNGNSDPMSLKIL